MPIWTLDKPPSYKKDAVATERGWEDPNTGELLIAIRTLADKAGSADVDAVFFDALTYAPGDPIALHVRFNERVNALAGVSVLVSSTGASASIQLFAAAQLGVQEVVFDKQLDLTTPAVVPAESATLSVAAQSLVFGAGSIADALGDRPYVNLPISAAAAAEAGTIEVVSPADVSGALFSALPLLQGDALAVTLHFDEAVDVVAGASILVASTGATPSIQLFAVAASNTQDVVFSKQADLLTDEVVPAESATLSLAAQSIVLGAGSINNHLAPAPAAALAVSAAVVLAAGTKVIA